MTRPRRLGRAAFDGILAGAFLLTWISPDSPGKDAYEWLEGVMFAQIAAVGLTTFLLYKLDIASLGGVAASTIVVAILIIFAFLIASSVVNAIGILIPFALLVYTLFALTYSKMPILQKRMETTYAFASVVCMALALITVVTLPMPRFGWANLPLSPLTKLYGSDPREQVHSLLACGTLYFSSIAVWKYRWRPQWQVPRFGARKRTRGAP